MTVSISIDRRKLATLVSIGITLIAGAGAYSTDFEDWRLSASRWLAILLPGDVADHTQVWNYINHLAKNNSFNQGLAQGFKACENISFPKNGEELDKLLRNQSAQSAFLNAFFEVAIEAFYGSELGFKELGLAGPPQPSGYKL